MLLVWAARRGDPLPTVADWRPGGLKAANLYKIYTSPRTLLAHLVHHSRKRVEVGERLDGHQQPAAGAHALHARCKPIWQPNASAEQQKIAASL